MVQPWPYSLCSSHGKVVCIVRHCVLVAHLNHEQQEPWLHALVGGSVHEGGQCAQQRRQDARSVFGGEGAQEAGVQGLQRAPNRFGQRCEAPVGTLSVQMDTRVDQLIRVTR